MRVSELELDYELEDVFILDYGSFYFFDGFIISEIKEGVLFDWEKAKEVIDLAYGHYGDSPDLVYISNRIYSYSVVPQDWLKFFSNKHPLKAMAVVARHRTGIINLMMEKLFFFSRIKKFDNLEAAIEWANSFENVSKTTASK